MCFLNKNFMLVLFLHWTLKILVFSEFCPMSFLLPLLILSRSISSTATLPAPTPTSPFLKLQVYKPAADCESYFTYGSSSTVGVAVWNNLIQSPPQTELTFHALL